MLTGKAHRDSLTACECGDVCLAIFSRSFDTKLRLDTGRYLLRVSLSSDAFSVVE